MHSGSKTFQIPEQRGLLWGVLALSILIPISFTTFGHLLEHYALDFLYASRITQPSPGNLLIVGIDDPSFQEFGLAWPWPRRMHAALVERLKAAGARLIVFDVVFADPTTLPDDSRFAQAIGQAGNVILAAELDAVDDPHFSRITTIQPCAPLRRAALTSGLASATPDPDGIIRHFRVQIQSQKTLAAATALAYDPNLSFPPDLNGLIDFTGPPRSLDTVSYYQVLDPLHPLPTDRIQDRIVLVGRILGASPSPQARTDTFYTPYYSRSGQVSSGVDIQGQIIHTLLKGSWRKELPPSGRLILYAVVIMAAAYGLAYLSPLPGLAAAAGLAFVLLGASAAIFWQWHYWIPPVLLVFGIGLVYSGNNLGQYLLEARERRWLRQAFGRYLSPAVVAEIIAHPEKLELGGEEVEGTVLFADLAGFTSLAETLPPRNLILLLNEYFSPLTQVILNHQGTLDKYIGDAIMAFWGAPLPLPDHARQACQAALEMRIAVAAMQPDLRRQGLPHLSARLGLHAGPLIAGNVGSRERFDYTVLGDTVNLASRLEGVNKLYGTDILVSESVHNLIKEEFVLRELDIIQVKGRDRPVTVYELLGQASTEEMVWLQIFDTAREAYLACDWDRSEECFQEVLRLKPNDGPSQEYLHRVCYFREHPPASDWQGIYAIKNK